MTQNDSDVFDWSKPSTVGKHITGLIVNNSFTKSKVPFIPEQGNLVKWYSCGPTVYDHAHLGHARTYVTGDIIRRILEHLGYRINFIMNITDVDDKIITRSSELGVNFSDFAKKWERDFWDDMQILGVRPPNCITRVSEFIPDIIKFIEKIIERGYAYQSKGSVYFDIESFSSKHDYARMEHSSVQIKERTLEGEGTLGEVYEKKSPIDFALWKQAKEGEPFWNSPWGNGRPGWHIECSVMASKLLGEKIDIHSGGIDLRFPHHDNEVAQSEAYFDKGPWINYFLHFGHLHIHGSKMSKSLKNFITIKEFLKSYTPRQMRLLFLMSKWDSAMNYSKGPDGMQHIVALDSNFSNFFPLIKSVIKTSNIEMDNQMVTDNYIERWEDVDMDLNNEYSTCIDSIEAALRDNFDTPNVIHSLQRLISATNSYITTNHTRLKKPLLSEILYTVSRYLEMLGLEYQNQTMDADTEALIDQIIGFRTKIRQAAKNGLKNDSLKACKEVLSLCDNLRDVGMPSIGFKMEDLPDGTALVKKIENNIQDDTKIENNIQDDTKLDKFNDLVINKKDIDPKDLFQTLYPGKFGTFDESYIPITYSNGLPVSKSERKSLEKIMNKHLQKAKKL